MFTGFTILDDGTQLLVLGLSKENRRRMEKDQPIRLSRKTHGMAVPEGLTIIIFAGETEESMEKTMAEHIGPTTIKNQRHPH